MEERKWTGTIGWAHYFCRNGFYLDTHIERFEVSEDFTRWKSPPVRGMGILKELPIPPIVEDWPEYAPVEYTSPTIYGKPWADPDISDPSFTPKWNAVDGDIDRRSYGRGTTFDAYDLLDSGRPKNPLGRTGITGRGVLGRWGPNYVADFIITHWKTNLTLSAEPEADGKPKKGILQFVAIQRKDTMEWAIPGGMVVPGKSVAETLRQKLLEEATISPEVKFKRSVMVDAKKLDEFDELFKRGDHVYKGYLDDPRNTDNAWIETTAVNFHDNDDLILPRMTLNAGNDKSGKFKWMDIDEKLYLYAEHKMLLRYVAILRNAHWL